MHVLLFDAGSDVEGIHSLELNGHTVVLLFEDADDAQRYAGLLEAQDFPAATVEPIPRSEMEAFCSQAGYEARSVPKGFMPTTAEERLMLAPPEQNLDTADWREEPVADVEAEPEVANTSGESADLEAFRRSLEGLL